MVNDIKTINKLIKKIENLSKEDLDKVLEEVDKELEEENKPFEDIFNKIKEKAKNFASLNIFVDEYYNEPGYEFVKDIKFVEPMVSGEEHRWFIVGNSVYSILINGEDYYFGASEVTTLKSETMSFEDTYWKTETFKVKKVIKECWEVEK